MTNKIRLITSSDTRLQSNLDGEYRVLLFTTTAISGSSSEVIFFSFNEESNKNIEGNNYFIAEGYLYDRMGITSSFKYIPECNEEQILIFKNLRNIKLSFYDKDKNNISITNWEMLLQKINR